MRTLVISDLHLGADGRLPQADGELCALLLKGWDQIVIAGDLFDLWVATIDDIFAKHRGVLAALDGATCRKYYLPGNHDAEFVGLAQLNSFEVVRAPFEFRSGDKSIGITHGNELLSLDSKIIRIGAWFGNVVDWLAQKIAGPGVSVQRRIRYSLAEMGVVRNKFVDEVAEKAVVEIGTDVVIVGHTHIPDGPRELGGRLYVNCGDWGPEHLTYVIIEDGKVTLEGAGQ